MANIIFKQSRAHLSIYLSIYDLHSGWDCSDETVAIWSLEAEVFISAHLKDVILNTDYPVKQTLHPTQSFPYESLKSVMNLFTCQVIERFPCSAGYLTRLLKSNQEFMNPVDQGEIRLFVSHIFLAY